MKKYIILVILSFLASVFPSLSLRGVYPRSNLLFLNGIASAAEQPRNDINKIGIHILEPADLGKAAELVNSSGGDWGWVTVVIRDDDMSHDKWQDFMDQCREKHLIPLVRIATHLEGSNWAKPKKEDSQKWVNFLSSLNWPIEDQYVIIFNEPNHAKEWGGEINPKEYSRILLDFSAKFKVQSHAYRQAGAKFKILNAGLDLAAPNGKETMDAYRFMQEMNWEIPGIFEKLDGWASHSYPNHGFVGKPWETGKASVKGYERELTTLKNVFGLKKELPVFITETGWPHQIANSKYQKAKSKINNYYSANVTAEYLKYAFENVWLKDNRVKAVTPFVLNYPDELFSAFSWLDKEGNPYPQFEMIKNLAKQSWWPAQIEKAEITSLVLPSFLPANTVYKGKIGLKNIGQSIWGEKELWQLPSSINNGLSVSGLALPPGITVKPGEKYDFDFVIKSENQPGEFEFNWKGVAPQKIKVFPASVITQVRYNLWERFLLKIKEIF